MHIHVIFLKYLIEKDHESSTCI